MGKIVDHEVTADWAETVRGKEMHLLMDAVASTAVQDGMLQHFLAQPTDWKTAKAADTEPFDMRDHMRKFPGKRP